MARRRRAAAGLLPRHAPLQPLALPWLASPPPSPPCAAPYLVHNEKLRNVLKAQGYEYDSSILEAGNTATSPKWTERMWPYTMDAGIPQDCTWAGSDESTCTATEKHAGLWEVPMWILPNEDGAPAWSMDPAGTPDALAKLLIKNFDEAYDGNRAPFPLFVHAPWFTFVSPRLAGGRGGCAAGRRPLVRHCMARERAPLSQRPHARPRPPANHWSSRRTTPLRPSSLWSTRRRRRTCGL